MRQGSVMLIACLVLCLGVMRANWAGAEELTNEEVAALKELLNTKTTSTEGQLTTEDVGALKELLHAYKDGGNPEEITVPHVAKVEPLTDDEVTGIREFMTTFKGIKFSGFVESFYQYNTVDPGTGNNGSFAAPGSGRRGLVTFGSPLSFFRPNFLEIRAFDKEDNSFTLNNIELHVYKDPTEESPIGFRITTLYGEQAQRLTFVPTDGRVDDDDFTVGEGFTWWKIPLGKGIDFKFGKFATWIGAEVWEAHWNPNWSRSLLYNNAIPFTNTGIVLGYPILDNLYGAFFFVNGWDTFVDNNKGKTFGFQFKYTIPDMPILHNSFVVLNTSHGPEQSGAGGTDETPNDGDFAIGPGGEGNWRHFVDFIFQFDPTSWLRLNTNVDYGTEQFERGYAGGFGTVFDVGDGRTNRKWWGVAQIVHLFPAKRINVALRGEYFWDKDAARNVAIIPSGGDPSEIAPVGVAIAEFTATCNIKIRDKLWIRPEVRYDKVTGAAGLTSSEQFDNHDKNISIATALTYEF